MRGSNFVREKAEEKKTDESLRKERLLIRTRALHGRSFGDLFLETIDEVLKQVFGVEGAEIILRWVKSDPRWEKNPDKPDVFLHALRRFLGSGAAPIEKLIIKALYSKLGLKFKEKDGYDSSDYVKELIWSL